MRAISISGRMIGNEHPPFVIAEMSGNHNGSIDRALSIVEGAARAGAHALKIQTYSADTMTLDVDKSGFRVADRDSLWYGKTLHSLYREAATPWDWHEPIFRRARELGLIAFSTPFDATAVDFLEELGAPCYKIASFENTDIPLIKKVADTGKPLIVSSGMATAGELDETVRAARAAGCNDLILLKCTSTYPANAGDSNIRTIPHLRQLFGCEVGLSDHTLGVGVAVAAVALGASVIEKHFTLSREEGGVDAAFSLEPDEMCRLVEETQRAWESLGTVTYGPTAAEVRSLAFRRSLYVIRDIQAGEQLTDANIRAIRPGHGLPPKFLEIVLGRRASQFIAKGTPLSWTLVD